jgi:hypothetical protein
MSGNRDTHGFSVSVAREIGVNRAIMLQHFRHLQIAFVDGEISATEIWVRRSRRALAETYPYLSEKEIRGCLDRLERDDYIRSKVENKLNYDRTKSYQLSKKGWELIGLPPSAQRANREQKASAQRANGFAQRANDNVTKGPMNIGSCSSFVDSIVEGERTPAPAVNYEVTRLEAEKNNMGLVAPPAAAPPTLMVTEIDPNNPDVRVVSPFTMPTRAATILEAEQKISAWILGDGMETVKYRHETAKRIFDTANANALAAHYVSVYASTNEGSRASLLRDPVAHFEAGLFKYLKNESAFERQNAPRESGQARPQTPNQSSLPRSLQNQIGK